MYNYAEMRTVLILLFLIGLISAEVDYAFYNDIPTNTNDLVVMFVPKHCNQSQWNVNYRETITIACLDAPKSRTFFEFNGAVNIFPYFVDFACFAIEYTQPSQNISTC